MKYNEKDYVCFIFVIDKLIYPKYIERGQSMIRRSSLDPEGAV